MPHRAALVAQLLAALPEPLPAPAKVPRRVGGKKTDMHRLRETLRVLVGQRMTTFEVAQLFGVKFEVVYAVIRPLESAGLIERVTQTRPTRFTATEAGSAWLEHE